MSEIDQTQEFDPETALADAIASRRTAAAAPAPSAETPEPTPTPAAPVQSQSAAAPAPSTPEPFEGYNALPEAARKRFDEQMTALKRLEGMVKPTQQQLSSAQQQLTAAQQAKAEADRQIAALRRQPVSQQQQRELAKWRQYAETYGEDAAAIEERVNALLEERLAARLGPMQEKLNAFERQTRDQLVRFGPLAEQMELASTTREILTGAPLAGAIVWGMALDDPRAKDPDFLARLQTMPDDQLQAMGLLKDIHGYHQWAHDTYGDEYLDKVYEENNPAVLNRMMNAFIKSTGFAGTAATTQPTTNPQAAATLAGRDKRLQDAVPPPRNQAVAAPPVDSEEDALARAAAELRKRKAGQR